MTNKPAHRKEYYSLTEMLELNLTPLRQRSLSNRFAKLLSSGQLTYGVNLHRTGSSWQIHHSAVPLFNYHSVMKLKFTPYN